MKVCIFLLCFAVTVRAFDGSSSGLSNYGARDRGAGTRTYGSSINFGGNSRSQGSELSSESSKSNSSTLTNNDQSQNLKENTNIDSQSETWQRSAGDGTKFNLDLGLGDNRAFAGQGTTDLPLNPYWKPDELKWSKANRTDSLNESAEKSIINKSGLQKMLEETYGDIFKFPGTSTSQFGTTNQANSGNTEGLGKTHNESPIINNGNLNNDPYGDSYGSKTSQQTQGYTEALTNGGRSHGDFKANSQSASLGNHKGQKITIVPYTENKSDFEASLPFDTQKAFNFQNNKQNFNIGASRPFCPFPGYPCGNNAPLPPSFDGNNNNYYHNIFKRGAAHYNAPTVMAAPPCPKNYIINCKATLTPAPCASPYANKGSSCNGQVSYSARSADNIGEARNFEEPLNSDSRAASNYGNGGSQSKAYGGSLGGASGYSNSGNIPASYSHKGTQSASVAPYGGAPKVNKYNGRPGAYGGSHHSHVSHNHRGGPMVSGNYGGYTPAGNPSTFMGHGGNSGYRFARANSKPNPLFLNFQKVNLC